MLTPEGFYEHNVLRTTRSLGLGERDVLGSTNVTKVDNVSIKHNAQTFGVELPKFSGEQVKLLC
jgi:hypothetical protein